MQKIFISGASVEKAYRSDFETVRESTGPTFVPAHRIAPFYFIRVVPCLLRSHF